MMKNALFIPGLFVSHKPYHWLNLVELATAHGVNLRIHERHRAIALDKRALALLETIREYPANESLHILASSAGGVDIYHCLYMFPELALRIKSITTIGSPFAGSLIADNILELKEECPVWEQLMSIEFLQKGLQIAEELSIKGRAEYNQKHKLAHSIVKKFYCVPTETGAKWKANLTAHKGYDLFKKANTPSDCTVGVASQTFGEIIKLVEGEHKSMVFPLRYGWPWQLPWKKTFNDYFDFINKNFNV